MKRRSALFGAAAVLLLGVAWFLWSKGAESRSVQRSVDLFNARAWGELYDIAPRSEIELMNCDRADFVRLMEGAIGRSGIVLDTFQKVAGNENRPASEFVVRALSKAGVELPNTLSLYVLEDEAGYSVSIGDLPFQVALMGPEDARSDLSFLSKELSKCPDARLLNARELLLTDAKSMSALLKAQPQDGELDPAAAWHRISGF